MSTQRCLCLKILLLCSACLTENGNIAKIGLFTTTLLAHEESGIDFQPMQIGAEHAQHAGHDTMMLNQRQAWVLATKHGLVPTPETKHPS